MRLVLDQGVPRDAASLLRELGYGRMFFAVWRRDNPYLFDALWRQISPNLRTHERDNLTEVVEQPDRELREMAPGYADFVKKHSDWRLPE
jgi:hypothetical protein